MSENYQGENGKNAKPYEQARSILENGDADKFMKIAGDENSFPEMLYFLSTDDNTEVRILVAGNPSTPAQADTTLSEDKEADVRVAVGGKIARRLQAPENLEPRELSAAEKVLEYLIEDEEVRVRRIIADAVKSSDTIPLEIVQKLARDIDEQVSVPVLHHSPLLDDKELLVIIEDFATPANLKAISNREFVSEDVSDSIAGAVDVDAISQLLINPNAQIREQTLDLLIEDAKDVPVWHEPLVRRPKLSLRAIGKIASFVATSLVEVLSQRHDIDDEMRAELSARVVEKLASEGSDGEKLPEETADEIEYRLRKMHATSALTHDYISKCAKNSQRDVVTIALAILADIPADISRRIFASLSGKAITSLCWRAEIPPQLATRIQGTVGRLGADDWIMPTDDGKYPFTDKEMNWQLALFIDQEELAAENASQDQKQLESDQV